MHETASAELVATNIPRFEQELAALRLELERLEYLHRQPDCPGEVRAAVEERMRQVRAQAWTAERSLQFLQAKQADAGPPGPGEED